jgi:hypothetical protein
MKNLASTSSIEFSFFSLYHTPIDIPPQEKLDKYAILEAKPSEWRVKEPL